MEASGVLCFVGFSVFIMPLHQQHNYPVLVTHPSKSVTHPQGKRMIPSSETARKKEPKHGAVRSD